MKAVSISAPLTAEIEDIEMATLTADDSSEVSTSRTPETVEHGELCEADHLLRIYGRSPEQLITLLSGQFGVLKTESQAILGLCGLAITVTGFSGGNIIKSGTVASGFLVAGIICMLVAGGIALRALAIIRWVTEFLDLDLNKTIRGATARRNLTRQQLVISSAALGVGLLCYLIAVSIAALVAGQLK